VAGRRPWLRRLAAGAATIVVAVLALGAIWIWRPGWIIEPLLRYQLARAGLVARSVEVDGDRWPYLERGDPAAPPVVVLHGFGADARAMAGFAPRLPDRRVIVPDLPGFGEHPLPDGMVPWEEEYVVRLAGFLRALRLERADLVASSMGGAIAGLLAVRHPELVGRLVLIAPAGVPTDVENEFLREAREGGNPLDIGSVEDLDRVLSIVFRRPPELPANVKRWLVARNVPHRAVRAAILETMGPFLLGGLAEAAAGIRVPTLVLWGDSDLVTDPSAGAVLVGLLPDAELVVVPDAGHVPWEDAPGPTFAAIRAFLAPPVSPAAPAATPE